MRRWPAIGGILAVLWLFVNGSDLSSPDSVLGGLLGGLVVGLPVAYAFRRFYNPEIEVQEGLAVVPSAVIYVALFAWELLTANLDVAYRTLAPSMPIEPDVVEIPLRVQSDLAITTIANSITLTPGTLTMDYDDERNVLYVHGITGENREAVVEPIRRWEDYALVMFDEELKPRDPVPNPDAGATPRDESAGASANPGEGSAGEDDVDDPEAGRSADPGDHREQGGGADDE